MLLLEDLKQQGFSLSVKDAQELHSPLVHIAQRGADGLNVIYHASGGLAAEGDPVEVVGTEMQTDTSELEGELADVKATLSHTLDKFNDMATELEDTLELVPINETLTNENTELKTSLADERQLNADLIADNEALSAQLEELTTQVPATTGDGVDNSVLTSLAAENQTLSAQLAEINAQLEVFKNKPKPGPKGKSADVPAVTGSNK